MNTLLHAADQDLSQPEALADQTLDRIDVLDANPEKALKYADPAPHKLDRPILPCEGQRHASDQTGGS